MVLIFLLLLGVLAEAIMRELDRSRDQHAQAPDEPCPGCGCPVAGDWLCCPHCRQVLRRPCPACGRSRLALHRFCVWCGSAAATGLSL